MILQTLCARLAQSVARGSHNPKVVSSILAPRNPFWAHPRKEAPEGFEPSTLRLLGVRSNQLSYGADCGATKERSRQDSNLQPLDPRSNALPLSHATWACIIKFRHRELNPGLLGESQVF